MIDAALLLLTDSRLPAGGHAHSGGAEEAVRTGAITDPDDLARFLRGRLATAGLVAAALAAAACELAGASGREPRDEADGDADAMVRRWRRLDCEADARTASPAQREAGRTQGRLLLRSARRIWPSAALDALALAAPDGTHHAVALGAVAAAAGCDPYQAALAAVYNAVTGPATAAVRLLGLDPVTVHRLLADLAPALNDTAHEACSSLVDAVLTEDPLTGDPLSEGALAEGPAGEGTLPAHAAPALDLLAERHRSNETKLFVS